MTATSERAGLVYESERARLFHAPAEAVLADTPSESVDLVIADPPYGQAYQSERRDVLFDTLEGDGSADPDRAAIRTVLAECVRVVGQHRHLYVFGPADVLVGLKVTEPVELVWDKGGVGLGDLAANWGSAHEPVSFVVSKWRHAGEAGRGSLAARMRKGSVIRYPRPTGRAVRHPTEKPWRLLREFVESSSRPGDLVLDPYAGSGSTGVAALLSGRRALLAEVDERWIPTIVARLRRAEEIADATEDV